MAKIEALDPTMNNLAEKYLEASHNLHVAEEKLKHVHDEIEKAMIEKRFDILVHAGMEIRFQRDSKGCRSIYIKLTREK